MKGHDDPLYLDHILECISRVEEDMAVGHAEFSASRLRQDAVLRNLQIMAESTQRLSDEIKATQPKIPWRQIAGLRNRLTHGYMELDLELIARISENHLPSLKAAVMEMINRSGR
ncbi:MAG: DUF86 domain-containing protein [SAR202 cluster bacterium]|nr:DUF86 domain-containing protein [SAR202 cluster bacterium]